MLSTCSYAGTQSGCRGRGSWLQRAGRPLRMGRWVLIGRGRAVLVWGRVPRGGVRGGALGASPLPLPVSSVPVRGCFCLWGGVRVFSRSRLSRALAC
eukprot:scaffold36269_cov124-Isochrysis_galbana.AAC.3